MSEQDQSGKVNPDSSAIPRGHLRSPLGLCIDLFSAMHYTDNEFIEEHSEEFTSVTMLVLDDLINDLNQNQSTLTPAAEKKLKLLQLTKAYYTTSLSSKDLANQFGYGSPNTINPTVNNTLVDLVKSLYSGFNYTETSDLYLDPLRDFIIKYFPDSDEEKRIITYKNNLQASRRQNIEERNLLKPLEKYISQHTFNFLFRNHLTIESLRLMSDEQILALDQGSFQTLADIRAALQQLENN